MGSGIAGAAGTGAAGEEGGHTEPEVNNNNSYYSYYSTVGARGRGLEGGVDQPGGGPLTPPQEPLTLAQRGKYRSKATE